MSEGVREGREHEKGVQRRKRLFNKPGNGGGRREDRITILCKVGRRRRNELTDRGGPVLGGGAFKYDVREIFGYLDPLTCHCHTHVTDQ